jgi:hypothetical protein
LAKFCRVNLRQTPRPQPDDLPADVGIRVSRRLYVTFRRGCRFLAAPLITNNIRFLAAATLCDFDCWRIGSIAALASQQHVARKGIAMRELAALGREFVGIAR